MALASLIKAERLLAKAAKVSVFGVLPGTMLVALIYSPPDYALPKKQADSGSSTASH